MKTLGITLLALAGTLAVSHGASLFEATYTIASGLLPDGDLNGRVDARQVSGTGGTITDVDVWLDVGGTGTDGGWVGDLHASLRHESGYAVLLNRPGRSSSDEFGVAGGGLAGWFDDTSGGGDAHLLMDEEVTYTGTWVPDGREVMPGASAASFDAAPRTAWLGSFVGLPVDGIWTLLLMDASSGAWMELRQWGLRISYDPPGTVSGDPIGPVSEVPEGTVWWVGGAMLAVGLLRRRAAARRVSQ